MKKYIILIIFIVSTMFLISCEKKERMAPHPDAAVPYLDEEWVAVFADEFDGDKLDNSKWNYEIGGSGWGNNELQYYTYTNAEVSDGTLKIKALKEDYNGKQYTSSRIVTSGKFNFRYGRVQVRAKMPSGKGLWPAIWMMPQSSKYGTWPNSGEIDIMEYVGYQKNVIHSSIHTKAYNHKIGTQQTKYKKYENVEDEFYIYELIWEPGLIETYVDGEKLATFKYNPRFNQDIDYKDAFPFDQEFFLILNVAVGGDWGGVMGVDDSSFPTAMEVDYVRVYQKDYQYFDKEAPEAPYRLTESTQKNNSIFWDAPYDDMGIDYYNVYIDGEYYHKTNLPQITIRTLQKNKTYKVTVESVDFSGKVSKMSEPLEFTFK